MKVSADLFQLKVLVNNRPVQEYHKDNHTFIEGRQGSNYALQLTNLTPRRLLVHPTVDGLSVMTGKEASRNDSSHGYVLEAYTAENIPGWRLDNNEVAKFVFAGAGESYAEKRGSGENKGVIACAVWEKKTEFATKGRIDRACGQSQGIAACNLGTGFGRAASHVVNETSFIPLTVEPGAIAVIYYDDIQGLKARGIKIATARQSTSLPNPFPKTEVGCIPPDGWSK